MRAGKGVPGLVTVLVTSYNHSQFLAQRMDSVVRQTYRNLEIVVIDDCSTQNNVEILRQYESDERVRIIALEKNAGLVPVMQMGLEMATGEFVIVAQCDDYCDPQMIEKLVAALRNEESAGFAFCRSLLVDERNAVMGDDYRIQERAFRDLCASDTVITGGQLSRFLLTSCVIPNLSALLMRKECLAAIGGLSNDYAVCVDWELFFRFAERYSVCYVAEPLNMFRQHKRTIRSITNARITYGEYLRLLLHWVHTLPLSPMERAWYRVRLMRLWAVHLVSPSLSGLRNFPYHARLVLRHDWASLLYFIPGVALRAAQVAIKIVVGREREFPAREPGSTIGASACK